MNEPDRERCYRQWAADERALFDGAALDRMTDTMGAMWDMKRHQQRRLGRRSGLDSRESAILAVLVLYVVLLAAIAVMVIT